MKRTSILAFLLALTLPLLSTEADKAEPNSIRVETSLKTWQKLREACGGNYSYTKHWSSFTGFGHRTTIVIRDNKVVERHYQGFPGHPTQPPRPTTPSKPAALPSGKSWKETVQDLGSHKQGHPPKTLDQLYAEATALLAQPRPAFQRLGLRFDKQGLLLACYLQDSRIADDAPTHGVNISKIELGLPGKAPSIPTFEEWVAGGKKIPSGRVFTGGSPWFNERTGKRRSTREVYNMLFNRKASSKHRE